MIFETHAHYDDKAFEQDRESLLKEMYFIQLHAFVKFNVVEIIIP